MREPRRPRPRPRPRRRRRHAGTTTPPSVAADSDASSTVVRRHWYDTFLLKGRDAHHEIAYDTQLDWPKRAFASAGVAITKKTHAGRGQGAREAETRGVTEFD